MIFSHVVYDAQFSFVTIYKVGTCMIPSDLEICSEFKSRVVCSCVLERISRMIQRQTHFVSPFSPPTGVTM